MGKFKGKPNRLGEVSLIGLPSHFVFFAGGGYMQVEKNDRNGANAFPNATFPLQGFHVECPPQPPLCSVRSSMCLWSVIDNVAQAALPNPAYWSMKQPEKVAR